jgi:hypothetical protein
LIINESTVQWELLFYHSPSFVRNTNNCTINTLVQEMKAKFLNSIYFLLLFTGYQEINSSE